ncbi:winged helix-turn-helix domain-containing protein [Cohnella thermotolerans]|uniref:winged helix-turn-helix domain-containing protein n=1 Tax=Cohnella thermotolerans TaxID=329858 RepID=UPI0003FEDED3|nr:winged helix-turn-helix domain-containing protein [Cohnella thermotolerans]
MKWKNSNLELLKILADPRRSRILHLAADRPVTVKMLAEQMGEDPLRLYYHVKKMVKAELLEIKETRQHGNLTEHYYQAVDLSEVVYNSNLEENAEHLETIMALVHRRLDPGLRLYRKGLELVREETPKGAKFGRLPYHVVVTSATSRVTGKEWEESLSRLIQSITRSEAPPDPMFPSDGREDEVGSYQYVLVSYRIEDAERLGLLDASENEEESGESDRNE